MKRYDLTKTVKKTAEELTAMNGFEIESLMLKAFKAQATDANTPGIDGILTLSNGKVAKLEIKSHGLNRSSLGRISTEKTIAENIADLLKADVYINVRPQTATAEIMTKAEFSAWLMDRVVVDRDRHGELKFKINYYERSKKQDRKLQDMGFEL